MLCSVSFLIHDFNFYTMKLYFSWKRLWQHFWLSVANLPMPGHVIRPFFVKLGGVKIASYQCFIGKNVSMDGVRPDLIFIEKNAIITAGTVILTHFANPKGRWYYGEVHIGEHAFIGIRTIITKPVSIGKDAMVGAGSIVTKDIPDYEVWAGNPARFVKKKK